VHDNDRREPAVQDLIVTEEKEKRRERQRSLLFPTFSEGFTVAESIGHCDERSFEPSGTERKAARSIGTTSRRDGDTR
jgi:hypothetical protein